MRYIADRYLKPQSLSPAVLTAVLLGILSLVLYLLLYQYSTDLVRMATVTHQGQKAYFLVPIVIALVFSLVHGTFTGRFWDLLGFKPRQQGG